MMESTSELPQLDTVALEYGGRLFPSEYADRYKRDDASASTIDQKASRTESRQELMENIWQQLPLAKFQATERCNAIEAYINSLAKLNKFREDVNRFLKIIGLANLEIREESEIFDDEQKQLSIDRKIDQMRKGTEFTIRPPRNHIDAGRATLPLELLVPELKNALRHSVNDFVEDFYENLRRLVDEQIFGLIEWLGENVCRYHFFRGVLLYSQSPPEANEDIVRFADNLWAKETTNTSAGRDIHRIARHEHHVISAFVTSSENTRVVMPPSIQQAVDKIPDWLKPIVSIVDGTLIREIIIEQDVFHEDWEKKQRHTEVVPEDDPIYGLEPAVIIDEFVLTGWGPREIESELARRQLKQTELDLGRRAEVTQRNQYLYFAGAIATQVISLWLLIQTINTPGSAFLSIVVFCAAPPLWLAAIRAYLESNRVVPGLLQPELRVIGWTVLAASLHVLVLGMQIGWGTVLFSIFLFCVGLVLAKFKLMPFSTSNSTSVRRER